MPPRTRKAKSGFCNSIGKPPQHEGTKPLSSSGIPMPVCLDWENCACACHTLVSKMYADLGMEREPPEQSHDYLVWVRSQQYEFDGSVEPLDGGLDVLSNSDGVTIPGDVEGAYNPPPSAHNRHASAPFTPTPTGRRARGQLEYDVLQVCREFADGVYDWEHCTPKAVSERIGRLNATEPPSTGAINAVWDRWERLEFATQAKKPSRFLQFTGDSSQQALLLLKGSIRREKKRTKAEIKRGSLRPRAR